MGNAFGGLLGSIGMALVITALVSKGRQTPQVIDAAARGISSLAEASLGYNVVQGSAR